MAKWKKLTYVTIFDTKRTYSKKKQKPHCWLCAQLGRNAK